MREAPHGQHQCLDFFIFEDSFSQKLVLNSLVYATEGLLFVVKTKSYT